MNGSVSAGMRFARACGVLIVLLLAALALEWFYRMDRPGVLSEAAGLSASALLADGWESVERAGGAAVPPDFEEEVVSLSSYADVRVDVGGQVVGFLSDERPEVEFALLSSALEDRGWVSVSSGSGSGGSFVKENGTYIWAFISCVGVGEGTSVVVNCSTADEEKGSQ